MTAPDPLARLAEVIESRKPANGGNPEASYVARLLHKGRTAMISATLCVPTILSVAAPPAGRTFSLVRATLALTLIGLVVWAGISLLSWLWSMVVGPT